MRAVICLQGGDLQEGLDGLVPTLLSTAPIELMILHAAASEEAAAKALAAREPRVRAVPGGRGEAASKMGLQAALGAGYDQVILMDPAFAPHNLPAVLAALEEADVVIGSRPVFGETLKLDFLRTRAANAYARALLELPCRDATSRLVGFKRHVLEALDPAGIRVEGPAFYVALKYRAHRLGFTLAEVPVELSERRRKLAPRAIAEAALDVAKLRVKDLLAR